MNTPKPNHATRREKARLETYRRNRTDWIIARCFTIAGAIVLITVIVMAIRAAH